MTLPELQNSLGYTFSDPEWLQLAITHSSWANEAHLPNAHNERLEFLGDAVLELCVSAELFLRYPAFREGKLTQIRTMLVGEKTLAGLARKIGLDRFLRMGAGEEKQGGRERDALLADAMEAVIAAVFQDGGYTEACRLVGELYKSLWPAETFEKRENNPKSRLQEICQHKFGVLPEYVLAETRGPSHALIYEMELRLPNGMNFRASATAQKKAEQLAAEMAVKALEE